MIRNILIALLAVIAIMYGYGYYHLTAELEKQGLLLTDTRDKAAKDLQAANEKFGNEERARQVAEKDAKSASGKLAEEQGLRDKAEAGIAAAITTDVSQPSPALSMGTAAIVRALRFPGSRTSD